MPTEREAAPKRGAPAGAESEGVEKTHAEVKQAEDEGEAAARRVLNEEKDDD